MIRDEVPEILYPRIRCRPCQLGRLLTGIAVICTLAVSTSAASARTRKPSSATTWPSGAFAGSRTGLIRFAHWRGKRVAVAHRFAAGRTWSDIELSKLWARFGHKKRTVLSIPMLPATDAPTTLEAGAAGSYDSHWRLAAERLVSAGMGSAIIRPGWEFNQDWSPWAAKSDPGAYAAYFRRIVSAMRSVPGQSFRFDWCPAAGYHGWDPRSAYPGNAFVDIVGPDQYDAWYNHPSATPQERWNFILNSTGRAAKGGLAFWARFAKAHGKPLALSEWGLTNKYAHMAGPLGGGGGDDPYYIRKMHAWFASHNMAYEAYLDSNAPNGHHMLQGGEFPRAAAVYKSLW